MVVHFLKWTRILISCSTNQFVVSNHEWNYEYDNHYFLTTKSLNLSSQGEKSGKFWEREKKNLFFLLYPRKNKKCIQEFACLWLTFSNCFRLFENESSNFVATTSREMQSLANKLPRFQFPIQVSLIFLLIIL